MSDKEKLLIGVIIMMLSAAFSYRTFYIDEKITRLEKRIDALTKEVHKEDDSLFNLSIL